MNARELLGQVHRLEIKTRRLVTDIFSGQYESVFRGMGMEFAEVREYVPGDEVRSIDWNVTARMGHPFIKKFSAEREMTVMLMVDGSASMRFGTAAKWKSELAAEVAAVLGFSAIRNNDKVGLCLFADEVESFIRPQKGRSHTLRMIRDILEYQSSHKTARLEQALRYLNRVVRRKAVVFLLSDFCDVMPSKPGASMTWVERLLAVTNKRHDLVALQVIDPRELTLPDAGLLALEDAESGHLLNVDTSNATVRRLYEERARQRQRALESMFRRYGIDHIPLRTDRSFVQPLMQFFQRRAKRFR